MRNRRPLYKLVAVLSAAATLTACGQTVQPAITLTFPAVTSSPSPQAATAAPPEGTPSLAATSTPTMGRGGIPSFARIFIIILENREFGLVIGSTQAPYLNDLSRKFGLATSYFAITHPSLPNYLALIGGSTFGVHSDCTGCFVDQPNLVDQLETAGKSWTAYMEGMPSPCMLGSTGNYAQKHNPFIYFDDIRMNPGRCSRIVPFEQFAVDLSSHSLPDFVWITPDLCHDAHDCPLTSADTWLAQWVPKIVASPEWAGSVLFITFDEGQGDHGCCKVASGGRVATVVISPMVKRGFESDRPYDHYALLRTIEDAWGLPPLGGAADIGSMADFFQP